MNIPSIFEFLPQRQIDLDSINIDEISSELADMEYGEESLDYLTEVTMAIGFSLHNGDMKGLDKYDELILAVVDKRVNIQILHFMLNEQFPHKDKLKNFGVLKEYYLEEMPKCISPEEWQELRECEERQEEYRNRSSSK